MCQSAYMEKVLCIYVTVINTEHIHHTDTSVWSNKNGLKMFKIIIYLMMHLTYFYLKALSQICRTLNSLNIDTESYINIKAYYHRFT